MPVSKAHSGNQGPATDKHNDPVVDPTKNVLDLVQAAITRQDDLRRADQALRLSEMRRLDEVAELRAQHEKELRLAESARIDAIRAVDQGNVTRASEVAAAQATTLATQLQTSAETLRAQVEATRITTADTLAAALAPIQADVAQLRQVQFTQQGEKAQQTEQRTGFQWSVGAVLASLALLVSLILGGIVVAKDVSGSSSTPTTTITCSGTPIVCR